MKPVSFYLTTIFFSYSKTVHTLDYYRYFNYILGHLSFTSSSSSHLSSSPFSYFPLHPTVNSSSSCCCYINLFLWLCANQLLGILIQSEFPSNLAPVKAEFSLLFAQKLNTFSCYLIIKIKLAFTNMSPLNQ